MPTSNGTRDRTCGPTQGMADATKAIPASRTAMGDDTFGSRMRRARRARGWSQDRLIQRMRQAAQQVFGQQLPCDRSMKAMVSRWENNWRVPDRYNRRVLAAALGVSETDLLGATSRAETREQ